MIKANIKTEVLKKTKNNMKLGMNVIVDVDGPRVIIKEELYNLLKEFEKQIPEVWADALERIVDDAMMDSYLEGDDEE